MPRTLRLGSLVAAALFLASATAAQDVLPKTHARHQISSYAKGCFDPRPGIQADHLILHAPATTLGRPAVLLMGRRGIDLPLGDPGCRLLLLPVNILPLARLPGDEMRTRFDLPVPRQGGSVLLQLAVLGRDGKDPSLLLSDGLSLAMAR